MGFKMGFSSRPPEGFYLVKVLFSMEFTRTGTSKAEISKSETSKPFLAFRYRLR